MTFSIPLRPILRCQISDFKNFLAVIFKYFSCNYRYFFAFFAVFIKFLKAFATSKIRWVFSFSNAFFSIFLAILAISLSFSLSLSSFSRLLRQAKFAGFSVFQTLSFRVTGHRSGTFFRSSARKVGLRQELCVVVSQLLLRNSKFF